MDKQTKTFFKSENHIFTSRALELLKMDFFVPLGLVARGKRYTLVVVYTGFTYVLFLATKNEVLKSFSKFIEKFKMTGALLFKKLEVIMTVNLKMNFLKIL